MFSFALVIAARAAAAEPTGDGAPAAGEEQPGTQPGEPGLLAGVERRGQSGNPDEHGVSIHGSPLQDSVAVSNRSLQGEPSHLKSPPAAGTPDELHDFWETAVY